MGSSVPGAYVCKTGVTTGTSCGAIWAVGQAHPDLPIFFMGVADIVNCEGDSGGPIYKLNKAYGITSAGDSGGYSGTYTFNTGIGTIQADCYLATWYVGAAQALAVTHTKLKGT